MATPSTITPELQEAHAWVLAQGDEIRQDGIQWALRVDEAVNMFDVDIEQLEGALCSSLGLHQPPASELFPHMSFENGILILGNPENTSATASTSFAVPQLTEKVLKAGLQFDDEGTCPMCGGTGGWPGPSGMQDCKPCGSTGLACERTQPTP